MRTEVTQRARRERLGSDTGTARLVETGEFQSRVRTIATRREDLRVAPLARLQRLVRGYLAQAWWLERLRTA
jgi:hypothetical protein